MNSRVHWYHIFRPIPKSSNVKLLGTNFIRSKKMIVVTKNVKHVRRGGKLGKPRNQSRLGGTGYRVSSEVLLLGFIASGAPIRTRGMSRHVEAEAKNAVLCRTRFFGCGGTLELETLETYRDFASNFSDPRPFRIQNAANICTILCPETFRAVGPRWQFGQLFVVPTSRGRESQWMPSSLAKSFDTDWLLGQMKNNWTHSIS